jgi:hypothetical protein
VPEIPYSTPSRVVAIAEILAAGPSWSCTICVSLSCESLSHHPPMIVPFVRRTRSKVRCQLLSSVVANCRISVGSIKVCTPGRGFALLAMIKRQLRSILMLGVVVLHSLNQETLSETSSAYEVRINPLGHGLF